MSRLTVNFFARIIEAQLGQQQCLLQMTKRGFTEADREPVRRNPLRRHHSRQQTSHATGRTQPGPERHQFAVHRRLFLRVNLRTEADKHTGRCPEPHHVNHIIQEPCVSQHERPIRGSHESHLVSSCHDPVNHLHKCYMYRWATRILRHREIETGTDRAGWPYRETSTVEASSYNAGQALQRAAE